MDKFSRPQIVDIFLIFPRKLASAFHANGLLWRQFAWIAKAYFLEKNKTIFFKMSAEIFTQS